MSDFSQLLQNFDPTMFDLILSLFLAFVLQISGVPFFITLIFCIIFSPTLIGVLCLVGVVIMIIVGIFS